MHALLFIHTQCVIKKQNKAEEKDDEDDEEDDRANGIVNVDRE